jgi:NAD(P)-dependent dehydrogenase (short-subunit alcohol dehydrogenase family)
MDLTGCSAVVTGGASGLGEAVSRSFADAGMKVALFDLDADRGERVAAEIGGVFCLVDVSDEASVERGFGLARAAHGQERVLVNCAGISIVKRAASRSRATGEIKRFPAGDFAQVIKVNLLGTFHAITASAAGMLTLAPLEDGERGVIVNTSSIAALEGEAGQAAYSASKAGIIGMTLPLARDFQKEGIRVNTILPGSFDTPLLSTAPPDIYQRLVEAVPFPHRLGRPREFASLVLEICRNSYFNGEYIRLDGGVRLGPK